MEMATSAMAGVNALAPPAGLIPSNRPFRTTRRRRRLDDVPTADVGREDAVGDHVTHRARVIADYLELLLARASHVA